MTDAFFAVDDDRIVGIIELQMNNGRNIDVKTKIDYYSRLSVCGENDSDTETFYFLMKTALILMVIGHGVSIRFRLMIRE